MDFTTHEFRECTRRRGEFDNVQFPRGFVDWHTHPDKCLSDNVCAIGLPSAGDVVGAAKGVASQNLFHLVFSREGTYAILLTGLWRSKFKRNAGRLQAWEKRVYKVIDTLMDQYDTKNEMTFEQYARLQRHYIRKLRDLEVDIQFFEGDTAVAVNIPYDCAMRSAKQRECHSYK